MRMNQLDKAGRDKLPNREFAFPRQRKESLEDATHVRNAVARFDQVKGVSDAERDGTWKRIEAAAERLGVKLNEGNWRELGKTARRWTARHLDRWNGCIRESVHAAQA